MKYVIRHQWGWNSWWNEWRTEWVKLVDATVYVDEREAQWQAIRLSGSVEEVR